MDISKIRSKNRSEQEQWILARQKAKGEDGLPPTVLESPFELLARKFARLSYRVHLHASQADFAAIETLGAEIGIGCQRLFGQFAGKVTIAKFKLAPSLRQQ